MSKCVCGVWLSVKANTHICHSPPSPPPHQLAAQQHHPSTQLQTTGGGASRRLCGRPLCARARVISRQLAAAAQPHTARALDDVYNTV